MKKDLEQRSKHFALSIIRLTESLPNKRSSDILARQVLRSATSIGANYREAQRGVSRADFKNKIGTVEKEAVETQYWLELIIESGLNAGSDAIALHKESSELLAIFTTMGKTLKR